MKFIRSIFTFFSKAEWVFIIIATFITQYNIWTVWSKTYTINLSDLNRVKALVYSVDQKSISYIKVGETNVEHYDLNFFAEETVPFNELVKVNDTILVYALPYMPEKVYYIETIKKMELIHLSNTNTKNDLLRTILPVAAIFLQVNFFLFLFRSRHKRHIIKNYLGNKSSEE